MEGTPSEEEMGMFKKDEASGEGKKRRGRPSKKVSEEIEVKGMKNFLRSESVGMS